MNGKNTIRLQVPAQPEYLALVRMVIAGAARIEPLLDEERVDDLRVIVSEACTNAIEALRVRDLTGVAAEAISVECTITSESFELLVEDSGVGFDPDDLETLPSPTDPSRLRIERGLGIPLIRALSDEVEITSGPNGTRVKASFRFPSSS